MAISFQCPNCGKKLKAPDSAAGKQSSCPGCGNMVTCPEPVHDAEVVEMTMEPIADERDPYGLADEGASGPVLPRAAPAPGGEDRRPCPMCGEMILATAAKCRYCGEVFDPTLKKVAGKKSKKSRASDENLGVPEVLLAVLCSGIGCIVGIVWMVQGKPKGLKMFGLSLLMSVIGAVVNVFLQQAVRQGGGVGP
jgi:predicted RNA-binding Zn-ribbon protein involved in translation (DUF1610 family)